MWLLSIVLWLLAANAASAAPGPVHETVLENGLKVVVKEDHRSPVVVSQVWYKVGSAYEHEGLTGISHVLEHMMFKGTAKHPPGEFSRIIAANGGRENAFTGRDYTAYFQQLEKSRLPVSFELEADRMRNLRFLPEEYKKELQVVIEERRLRTDDDPRSRLYEHFLATAHTNGPYRNPIIGWPDDLEHLGLDDVEAWYRRWYAPNNATLVVVGDVQPQEVVTLARKYFGPLQPSADLKPPKPRTEVPQQGRRQITMRLPAELPYLLMGYKVPSLKTADSMDEAYALEVLAGILSGGNSARLASRVVRGKQIAASADSDYGLTNLHSSLFEIEATPVAGQSLDKLEAALRQEIETLRMQPVARNELERVKAQVLAAQVYQRDSVFYQALQIGILETVGLGWRTLDEYIPRIEAVTAEQVQAVARKYLVDDRLTVAYLQPLPINGAKPAKPAHPVGDIHVR